MIPISTTTIDVLRVATKAGTDNVDRLLDSYGAGTSDTSDSGTSEQRVARSVRAHIGSPGGTEQIVGGDQEVVTFRLTCDPVDIFAADRVRDNSNGVVYDVVWATRRDEFRRFSHVQAALSRVRGAA